MSKRKRKQSGNNHSLIYDIICMAIIHYFFFLSFAAFWSSNNERNDVRSYGKIPSFSKDYNSGPTSINSRRSIGSSNNSMQIPNHDEMTNQHIVYEPGYPKKSRIHYFPTYATEKEMAKHDRYLVHGILYTDMLSDDYLQKHWSLPNTSDPASTRKICMTIFMKNRSQPYINALIMSLMMSHEEDEEEKQDGQKSNKKGKGHDLLSFIELNLFDVERNSLRSQQANKESYDRQREKILSLPFLNVHRPYMMNNRKNNPKFNSNTKSNLLLNKIQDYILAADTCIQSKLPYCLIMEEYNIVPIDFLQSIQKYVIKPLEEQHNPINTGMTVISLFSAYDSKTKSIMNINDVEYSRNYYEYHRGKLNSELSSLDLPEHTESTYDIIEDDEFGGSDGYNSAMIFLTSIVKEQLMPFLEETKRNLQEKNFDLDEYYLDLEKEFVKYTNGKRFTVEPSLINRIGFYDQDYDDDKYDDDERLGITNWLTDPRFVFEVGEYWEDRNWYCMKSDGSWIERNGEGNGSECV